MGENCDKSKSKISILEIIKSSTFTENSFESLKYLLLCKNAIIVKFTMMFYDKKIGNCALFFCYQVSNQI